MSSTSIECKEHKLVKKKLNKRAFAQCSKCQFSFGTVPNQAAPEVITAPQSIDDRLIEAAKINANLLALILKSTDLDDLKLTIFGNNERI